MGEVALGWNESNTTGTNDLNNVAGEKPMTLKPGGQIPSWSDPSMPGMGRWPEGVHNVVADCEQETKKFSAGEG
jgi:hypothetical protein